MKRRRFALSICAVVTAFLLLSNKVAWQELARMERKVSSRMGISMRSIAETGGGNGKRIFVVLLNLNCEKTAGQLQFDRYGHMELMTVTYRSPDCH